MLSNEKKPQRYFSSKRNLRECAESAECTRIYRTANPVTEKLKEEIL